MLELVSKFHSRFRGFSSLGGFKETSSLLKMGSVFMSFANILSVSICYFSRYFCH